MEKSTLISLLTFVPQWLLVVVAGITFYFDLFTAMFLQAWFFVMFNKVMTAQYYMWYISFVPLILVNNRISKAWFLALNLLWVLGQACWGFFAAKFEFEGEATLEGIQLSNFAFLIINLAFAWVLLRT